MAQRAVALSLDRDGVDFGDRCFVQVLLEQGSRDLDAIRPQAPRRCGLLWRSDEVEQRPDRLAKHVEVGIQQGFFPFLVPCLRSGDGQLL